ncbi:hypothetical protein BDN70DRAFT_899864 [Pholiota conissans]|uniref:Uncharacterized protein n=1 Tax=Pholiota conissans TaxID=109636 RepID=A0A9P5YT84_9AGAR|nr:hypothetical protein BDN70DRAFT_899864 [Pholiota conissans]
MSNRNNPHLQEMVPLASFLYALAIGLAALTQVQAYDKFTLYMPDPTDPALKTPTATVPVDDVVPIKIGGDGATFYQVTQVATAYALGGLTTTFSEPTYVVVNFKEGSSTYHLAQTTTTTFAGHVVNLVQDISCGPADGDNLKCVEKDQISINGSTPTTTTMSFIASKRPIYTISNIMPPLPTDFSGAISVTPHMAAMSLFIGIFTGVTYALIVGWATVEIFSRCSSSMSRTKIQQSGLEIDPYRLIHHTTYLPLDAWFRDSCDSRALDGVRGERGRGRGIQQRIPVTSLPFSHASARWAAICEALCTHLSPLYASDGVLRVVPRMPVHSTVIATSALEATRYHQRSGLALYALAAMKVCAAVTICALNEPAFAVFNDMQMQAAWQCVDYENNRPANPFNHRFTYSKHSKRQSLQEIHYTLSYPKKARNEAHSLVELVELSIHLVVEIVRLNLGLGVIERRFVIKLGINLIVVQPCRINEGRVVCELSIVLGLGGVEVGILSPELVVERLCIVIEDLSIRVYLIFDLAATAAAAPGTATPSAASAAPGTVAPAAAAPSTAAPAATSAAATATWAAPSGARAPAWNPSTRNPPGRSPSGRNPCGRRVPGRRPAWRRVPGRCKPGRSVSGRSPSGRGPPRRDPPGRDPPATTATAARAATSTATAPRLGADIVGVLGEVDVGRSEVNFRLSEVRIERGVVAWCGEVVPVDSSVGRERIASFNPEGGQCERIRRREGDEHAYEFREMHISTCMIECHILRVPDCNHFR